jgi:2-oxoacid:acceptor oxidoreductase delta subunit (pyruvate/2-ketoisovalerate family)
MTDIKKVGASEAEGKKPAGPAVGRKLDWQELAIGGVILDAGNAATYETGDWRSQRPIFHPERCIQCLFCWAFCPDDSIKVQNGKVVGVDYFHCKGCGICSVECPVKGEKALTMEDESKFEAKEG